MTTTIRQIDLPVFSTNQKIAFGILCAKEVCHNDEFNKWANEWLDGSNRTKESAAAAVYAAAYSAADDAVRAAAVTAARAAVLVAYSAASAPRAAACAADYATCVAKINLVDIAKKAMVYM